MTYNAGIRMPLGSPASYEAYLRKQYEDACRRTYGRPKERNNPGDFKPKPKPIVGVCAPATYPQSLAWKEIALQVCAKHGIALREMIGSTYPKLWHSIRCEAWWRCHTELSPQPSSGQIGMWFKRDHSTILYGLQCWRDAHPSARSV